MKEIYILLRTSSFSYLILFFTPERGSFISSISSLYEMKEILYSPKDLLILLSYLILYSWKGLLYLLNLLSIGDEGDFIFSQGPPHSPILSYSLPLKGAPLSPQSPLYRRWRRFHILLRTSSFSYLDLIHYPWKGLLHLLNLLSIGDERDFIFS